MKATSDTLYPQNVGTNFADKLRSLGRIVRSWTKDTAPKGLALVGTRTAVVGNL
jgi:hypothetical protein